MTTKYLVRRSDNRWLVMPGVWSRRQSDGHRFDFMAGAIITGQATGALFSVEQVTV